MTFRVLLVFFISESSWTQSFWCFYETFDWSLVFWGCECALVHAEGGSVHICHASFVYLWWGLLTRFWLVLFFICFRRCHFSKKQRKVRLIAIMSHCCVLQTSNAFLLTLFVSSPSLLSLSLPTSLPLSQLIPASIPVTGCTLGSVTSISERKKRLKNGYARQLLIKAM